jgi:uncharacterized protein YkwD
MFFSYWALLITIIIVILLPLYLFKWRKYRHIVSFKGRLLSQENLARKRKRLQALGRVVFLDRVAVKHSKSMARRKSCDHQGFPRRASLIKDKTGLDHIGENCYMFPARKYTTRIARELLHGWLKSPGHRANLLNPTYKRTGIGIIVRKGYVYATQMFTN